jgi:hypothetical protein
MGVPPPPGSTCGPIGTPELASRLGLVEAPAKVETQHAAAVLGTIRLDHLPKTNLAELGRPRESASCKTAFAVTSPACRAAGSDGSIARRDSQAPRRIGGIRRSTWPSQMPSAASKESTGSPIPMGLVDPRSLAQSSHATIQRPSDRCTILG